MFWPVVMLIADFLYETARFCKKGLGNMLQKFKQHFLRNKFNFLLVIEIY